MNGMEVVFGEEIFWEFSFGRVRKTEQRLVQHKGKARQEIQTINSLKAAVRKTEKDGTKGDAVSAHGPSFNAIDESL
jgi:hypothetical protein